MKETRNILGKVLLIPFYRYNAGLFLVIGVLFFGMVPNPVMVHYHIMQSLLGSARGLLLAMGIILLYQLRCLFFIRKELFLPENIFLKNLLCFSRGRRALLWLCLHVAILAPALLYAGCTVGIGLAHGQYGAALMLAFFLLLAVAGSCLCTDSWLGSGKKYYGNRRLHPVFSFPKPLWSLLLWHSYYDIQLKVLAVKAASLILLSVPVIRNGDVFQLGDFVLFLELAIAAHAVLLFDYVQFWEKHFSGLRNLFLPFYVVFGAFALACAVLLLPEALLFVCYRAEISAEVNIAPLLLFCLAQLLLFIAVQYEKNSKLETYTLYVALIVVASFFVLPLRQMGLLALAQGGIAFAIMRSLYYNYEPE